MDVCGGRNSENIRMPLHHSASLTMESSPSTSIAPAIEPLVRAWPESPQELSDSYMGLESVNALR